MCDADPIDGTRRHELTRDARYRFDGTACRRYLEPDGHTATASVCA